MTLTERSRCGIHRDSTASGRCGSCDAQREYRDGWEKGFSEARTNGFATTVPLRRRLGYYPYGGTDYAAGYRDGWEARASMVLMREARYNPLRWELGDRAASELDYALVSAGWSHR